MEIELNVVTKRLVTCGGGRNTYELFGTSDFKKSEFDNRMGGRLAQSKRHGGGSERTSKVSSGPHFPSP